MVPEVSNVTDPPPDEPSALHGERRGGLAHAEDRDHHREDHDGQADPEDAEPHRRQGAQLISIIFSRTA